MTPEVPAGISYRPALEADLPACAELWRDGINDYLGRLSQPLIPDEQGATGRLGRLHAHTLATDPERFVVACRRDAASGAEELLAFGSAIVRERVWFLSMLFVRPDAQARGLGREVLRRIAPPADADLTMVTSTDSAQPVSNALYASVGIVPRMPLWNLTGGPTAGRLADLPSGVRPMPFATFAESADDGHARLVDAIERLDRGSVGFAHPIDHRYLRTTESTGFMYLGADDAPLGYGYASPVGRIGPVAVQDAVLLAPVVGHLMGAVAPRGGQAIWVPGDAAELLVGLLASGFRMDPFPVLLCWTRPFADFGRYLPISPGLL